eukprot:TRINITY_DN69056_c0_g1_i1.p1 TRINITY_DN69056_c0_g1~~TRINITY_DN69056_c0_g1_i1.p1  ORF type:complete len:723 (+),score=107.73 TRINITY_DN69056_c0_g1_i1:157-2325(+)
MSRSDSGFRDAVTRCVNQIVAAHEQELSAACHRLDSMPLPAPTEAALPRKRSKEMHRHITSHSEVDFYFSPRKPQIAGVSMALQNGSIGEYSKNTHLGKHYPECSSVKPQIVGISAVPPPSLPSPCCMENGGANGQLSLMYDDEGKCLLTSHCGESPVPTMVEDGISHSNGGGCELEELSLNKDLKNPCVNGYCSEVPQEQTIRVSDGNRQGKERDGAAQQHRNEHRPKDGGREPRDDVSSNRQDRSLDVQKAEDDSVPRLTNRGSQNFGNSEAPASCCWGTSLAQKIVSHTLFDSFFAFVILTNCIFIGVEMEYDINRKFNGKDPEPLVVFKVFGYVYNALFFFELLLRLIASGYRFFLSRTNWHWNYLDVVIVGASLGEVILDVYSQTVGASAGQKETNMEFGSKNIRILRVLRLSRLMRVFRVARILRFINALRTLVYSIVCTLKSVFWALLLLLMIIYVFAMIFASFVNDASCNIRDITAKIPHLKTSPSDVVHYDETGCVFSFALREHWGTLLRSMFTLFKTISGGISWHDVVIPLPSVNFVAVPLFVGYVSFTFFAVLNVITGVFCESAIESTRSNQDMVLMAHVQNRKNYVRKIKNLFKQIDVDCSNAISSREFTEHLHQKHSHATFATLELEITEPSEIFCLIDTDRGGSINMDEFVDGCLRLRGQARAVDVARFASDTRTHCERLDENIKQLSEQLQSELRRIKSSASLHSSE